MGRSTLFAHQAQFPTTHHQVFAVFLAVTWMATAVAVFLSLCSTCIRKSSSKTSSSSLTSLPANVSVAKSKPDESGENRPPREAPEVEAHAVAMEVAEKDTDVTFIPVEAAATHGPIPPVVLPTSSSSKRKLSLSFGKGLSEKLRTSRRERKGEGEDTIWKKTIILGEKCKVTSDDEEEEEVDEKGNAQRYYHPRTPRSRRTSRNNSFSNPDEAPQVS